MSDAHGGVFRGWVPEVYADEVSPPPRPTPSAWLKVGDVAYLDAPDAPDECDAAARAVRGPVVREGEILTFFELTDYPDLRLHFHGATDFSLEGVVPDGASLGMPGGYGPYGSMSELVASLADEEVDPGSYSVACYRWCDREFVLRAGVFVSEVAAGVSGVMSEKVAP